MRNDKRFKVLVREGNEFTELHEILIDTVTGVNYLLVKTGYAGGLTVLLDSQGKPVVTPGYNKWE